MKVFSISIPFKDHAGPTLAAPCCAAALVLLAFGAAQMASAARSAQIGTLDQRCQAWDRAASEAVTAMMAERNAVADRYLGDTIFRLQRARRNCRHDFVRLAQPVYQWLIENRDRDLR
jgi:hypothetical protein